MTEVEALGSRGLQSWMRESGRVVGADLGGLLTDDDTTVVAAPPGLAQFFGVTPASPLSGRMPRSRGDSEARRQARRPTSPFDYESDR